MAGTIPGTAMPSSNRGPRDGRRRGAGERAVLVLDAETLEVLEWDDCGCSLNPVSRAAAAPPGEVRERVEA